MLLSFTCRCLALCLPLFFALTQNIAQSESRLTPTLELEETFLSNKTATLDESGQITTISPGVLYEATGSNANIFLDYSLNARKYNDLSQDDEVDHSLLFRSNFTHVPNHWDSYITSTIKQANVSSDAIQIVNPIIQSDNTREFRTLGIGTSLQGKWTDNIDYHSGLNADYADFEGTDSTDSIGIFLGLSSKSLRDLFWRALIRSREANTAEGDEQINTAEAELKYRINLRYSAFLSIDKSETGEDFLDETNTIIGIEWTPNRNNSLQLGVGKRGDDTTYFLDTLIRSKRITYTLKYDETVTTSRTQLIDETNQQGFFSASQTLSINPVLIKNGRIAINFAGRRTDIRLEYFLRSTNRVDSNSDDEITDGLNISIKRTLSELSSVQLYLSRQDSETTQENTIDDSSLSYSRQLSKKVNFSVELRKTEQVSNVTENEYDQKLLGFRLNATF